MKEKPKLKEVRISTENGISYKALDDTPGGGNLGRAEFQFCPVWVRGRMREMLIYPKQQHTADVYYRLDLTDCGKVTVFHFESYSSGRSEKPHPWRMFWCKEHKAVSYEVYVPNGTDHLSFSPHFGNSVSFCFERKAQAATS